MPGYVMHLALANKLLPDFDFAEERDINNFILGNIVPDIKKGDLKKHTHFWNEETMALFERKPDLSLFLKQYGDRIKQPFVLGYYTHLFFDYYYVNDFWKKHYSFYDGDMQPSNSYEKVKFVKVVKNGNLYDRFTFFSDEFFYGDYSRMVPYIVSGYNIEKLHFREIDNIICEILDSNAKAELGNMINYINSSFDSAGSIEKLKVFEYEEIDQMIDDVAEKIIESLLRIK